MDVNSKLDHQPVILVLNYSKLEISACFAFVEC